MNNLFDILVVGASSAGIKVFNELLRAGQTNILLVDRATVPKTRTKGPTFCGNAIYTTYLRGMIGVYIENSGEYLWTRKLVVATGRAIDSKLGTHPMIVHDITKVKYKYLKKPILINGFGVNIAKHAIELAKKFSYVYVCNTSATISPNDEINKITEAIPNLLFLPRCEPKSVQFEATNPNRLASVTLTSGSVIKCAQLYEQAPTKIDLSWVNTQLLGTDACGYAEVNENFSSKKLPTIFAIGSIIPEWHGIVSVKSLVKTLLTTV